MFDKLELTENRYEEINLKLSDPGVISNQDEYRKLMKEFSELEEIILKYREYKKVSGDISDALELLNDRPENVAVVPPSIKASGISSKQTTAVMRPAENSSMKLRKRLDIVLIKKAISPPIPVPVIPETSPMSVALIKFSICLLPTIMF